MPSSIPRHTHTILSHISRLRPPPAILRLRTILLPREARRLRPPAPPSRRPPSRARRPPRSSSSRSRATPPPPSPSSPFGSPRAASRGGSAAATRRGRRRRDRHRAHLRALWALAAHDRIHTTHDRLGVRHPHHHRERDIREHRAHRALEPDEDEDIVAHDLAAMPRLLARDLDRELKRREQALHALGARLDRALLEVREQPADRVKGVVLGESSRSTDAECSSDGKMPCASRRPRSSSQPPPHA